MKQKFRKLTFVRVGDDTPKYEGDLDNGIVGIVDGTHSQLFGGGDIYNYSIYQIEDGRIIDNISWYREDQFTALTKQNRKKAEQMIEDYELGDENETY